MENNFSRPVWISPECDFEEMRNNGKYTEMIDVAKNNADLIISLCRQHENESLQKSIRYGIAMLSYFERSLPQDAEIQAIFWVGKLTGYLEAIEKLQFTSDQEHMAYERAKLTGTRHLNDIILALETHGPMSQTELCGLLEMNASTLSEALKRIRKTQLIQASPYGKYKIYSLTESGKAYGLSLRIKHRKVSEMDDVVEKLSQYLMNPESKSACLRAIRDRFPRDTGVFITTGDQISVYECQTKSLAKFDINLILQRTTNQPNSKLTVLAGTMSEFNIGIVNHRCEDMQFGRKECV